MCGIAGMIGQSTSPRVSYQIATKLLAKSESRGNDASGYWGVLPGEDGSVIYHKEPTAPTKFILTEGWKKLFHLKPNLLILHARQTSPGMGNANTNRNNHPFTNHSKNIGLVHNGKIPDYPTLKKRYQVLSDCDSEILLRIYESSIHHTPSEKVAEVHAKLKEKYPEVVDYVSKRAIGFQNIYSYIHDDLGEYSSGKMAVALGERLSDGSRYLWLFRNTHRTLWVIDARKSIGQIFFCSTPEIWIEAMKECPEAKKIIGTKCKIIEMPHDEVWMFRTDMQHPVVDPKNIVKFTVKKKKDYIPWNDQEDKVDIIQSDEPCHVITSLDDRDEIIPLVSLTKEPIAALPAPAVIKQEIPIVPIKSLEPQKSVFRSDLQEWMHANDLDFKYDVEGLNRSVADIKRLVSDIETAAENCAMEQSLSVQEFAEHLESLDAIKLDLEGTLRMIESYSYS